MNHFLLHLLTKEIGPSLAGHKIRAIRMLRPLVSIELAGGPQNRYLVVVLATPGPFCFMSSKDPVGSSGAAALKRIHGERVSGEAAPSPDRILSVDLEPSGDTLVITLFGSGAKVRVQSTDHIVESIDPSETGTPTPTAKRSDKAPFATLDPVSMDNLTTNDAHRAAPGLDGALARCFAGEDGNVDRDALFRFRDDLLTGAASFDLATNGRMGGVTPILAGSTADATHRFGPFKSALEACEVVGHAMVDDAYEAILDRLRGTLSRHLDKRSQLLQKLQRELQAAEDFEVGRNEADILAAYQSQIPAGVSEIELPDLYEKETTRKITLDPSTPISKQIQKRYKRATKLERSRVMLEKRIELADADIASINDCLLESEKSPFPAALESLQKAASEHKLLRQDRRVRSKEPVIKQHRRFDLDDHWFVLVGRSDQENDEITFKIASPDDVWMHAQQVAGSHIVLRSSGAKGNPPKKVLEQTAAIAAFYSKARNSKLVPVIYTKRKYVRKFRGAKRGQVVCEREKTIFVEPELPE